MEEVINFNTEKAFLEKVHKFNEQWWAERFDVDTSQFQALKLRLLPFEEKLAEMRKKDSPDFNIFRILNVHHYEEVVHTPVLGHLLDPKGDHAQGSLFLDSFFDKVVGMSNFRYLDTQHFEIYEEMSTPYGRLDIVMHYNIGIQDYKLIIENKIYAADQKKQLDRYYRYLSAHLKLPAECMKILYLKPHAAQPSHESINKELYDSLRSQGLLLEVGYKEHIMPWLEGIIGSIESDTVKSFINQYYQIIRSL